MATRKPVIGVVGGADVEAADESAAYELGKLIARRGWILLNGGRDCGVMSASARGAKKAGGLVIGILPGPNTRGASPDLDIAIVTGMGEARNVINVLSCDVVVACSGGAGTLSEVALALKSNRPVILLGWTSGAPLAVHRESGLLQVADTPEDAVGAVDRILSQRR